ncbi:uncharacterized protein LOC124389558 isoform X2 [Silurus meridionalis]|uniref:uncharacterized protein LOC124389558 isoform X2 n=1 Tax=Silurus meridionalis TaxID=175797 RepID=UPI001EEC0AAB|nr:uncharacterized protein LOC124389558 isoform X2 [Silurus meridionalis]
MTVQDFNQGGSELGTTSCLYRQPLKRVKAKAKAKIVKLCAPLPCSVAGGLIGLALTLPDLVKNCEELIKKEHETEASEYLKKKANEIRENVEKLRRKLDELQEILNQIP